MEFVIFVSFLDTLLENVLHRDPFILILLDLPMGEEEEAEVLIIISQEHLSLQEEGGAEEEEDNDMKKFFENMMEEKFKMLKREKSNVKRAKKMINKDLDKRKKALSKLKKNPNDIFAKTESQKSGVSAIDRAERAYAKGFITKERLKQIYQQSL